MYPILLTIHVIIALLVILVVLLQAGRSGGLSGLMGGGGGDAIFSSSAQQSGLRKITIILAGLFMATSLGLTFLSSRIQTQTVIQKQFPQLPPLPQQEAPTDFGDDALPPKPADGKKN